MTAANPIRAVLFDLDGTLADTAGEIAWALNLTLTDFGKPTLAQAQVTALVGRGVRSLVERALANVGAAMDVDAAVERFEAHYAELIATQASLFPGVLAGLELLRSSGCAMGVVTNKPRFFTERLLQRLAVADFFVAVVTGDDGIPRKPRGDMLTAACRKLGSDPESTLMIGDSDNDVLAARDAGCPVWCVTYGYNEGRPPESLACDRLVATVSDAARVIVEGIA
jgi:phosphoglycolate phosphatase